MAGSRTAAASGCPCGSGSAYSRCCRPLHLGAEHASSAEALMRSRYSAFAKGLSGYLSSSWHPEHRPDPLQLDPEQRWTGLRILATSGGGADDDSGIVEFVATFERAGSAGRVQEVSRFVRLDGRWVYTTAVRLEE